ncbi:hypothetical protein GLOIN_2v1545568 [Rhizophagus irregularis DAOM 181602=DAOM 197198]|uniref:Uncharacterized protein n=1 Tax=Rhizophagus irregularis (strain DAOM 181602 / DAOM 197198 / MUCL 43194) TaxID=747089 RepID=A0A2P4QIX7_RHIID|nr:hypothetical protein GLOIN_2v1545568 [Rhizophagus irregularis DAOM 181602=DAOM 197198]POG77570.1 hypothetical protein GLOIN_2v1545568 [Rhizophagus irregularis DAOM 181602=DAOM 197198]|eukprot:XP_025184436.1 hypothetical protein GLOIN_2v1545568 [Rhizophagus irregularis DAOM 181602=DAOM 197198]
MSSIIELSDIDDYNEKNLIKIENNSDSKNELKKYPDTFSEEVATIQYSTNGSGGTINIQECPFFERISIKKNQRKCQGIKFYQFTDPEFINQEHSKNTPCNFKKNNILCNGRPHIGRITNYQTNTVDSVDISLLQSLFTGFASIQDIVKCSMILSKSCKHKKYMPHIYNGSMELFYDIVKCPFVALVCIGTHNHSPSNNLESLINQDIQQDDNVTSRSILSGNLLSAYFNKETLAEVHVSLNNIDKLRYLVGKAYKTLHHFGQGVIGIYHDILNPKSDLINYVRKIDLYSNNGQVIITCMLDNQAKKLITLDYFQIDVSFKRVKGEINEFEINKYDSKHHLILSFCRIFTNVFTAEGYHRLFSSLFQIIREVSGQSIQFRHIHGSGIGCILADLDAAQAKGLGLALHDLDHEKSWETHLTFILKTCLVHFERNLFHKTFTISTKNLIRQIPNATSKEQVHDLLQQIEDTNDEGIKEWLNYYQQSYVLSSLNKYVSNVDHEIWNKSGSDTNNAEAAHSMANREGKQLKLLSAILKGKRYDARCYITIEVHNKNGVPYTHRDKSDVKRLQNSIVRKTSRIQKNKVSLNDKLPKSSKKKRKLSPSNSRTPIRSKENHERAENILSDNEEETFSKEIHKKNLELELKEKEIILKLKHE